VGTEHCTGSVARPGGLNIRKGSRSSSRADDAVEACWLRKTCGSRSGAEADSILTGYDSVD
jgi:hypothetical protein